MSIKLAVMVLRNDSAAAQLFDVYGGESANRLSIEYGHTQSSQVQWDPKFWLVGAANVGHRIALGLDVGFRIVDIQVFRDSPNDHT